MPEAPRRIGQQGLRPDHRPPAHKRGYDHDWQRVRALKVSQDPLCEDCLLEGRTTPVAEVDHVEPIEDAPDRRLDLSNLRSLCKPHHKQKTDRDKARHSGQRRYVVWGLPASGKTTWVEQRASAGDVVWDADAVAAAVFGLPTYPRPAAVAQALGAMRAALLRTASTISGAVYVIESEHETAARLAREIVAKLVHVECDEAVRQERLRERAGNGDSNKASG